MILQNGKSRLTLPAAEESLSLLHDFLESVFQEISFPKDASQKILICADEIFTNTALYAYPGKEGMVDIELDWNAGKDLFSLTFSDEGIAFDPLAHQDPDTKLPAGERMPGGLGILLVKRLMDHVSYRRDGSFNRLVIAKNAGKETGV